VQINVIGAAMLLVALVLVVSGRLAAKLRSR
jgi:hypothetical protein